MWEGRTDQCSSQQLASLERKRAEERSEALLNATYLLLTFLYLVVFLYDDWRAAALLACVYLLATCVYLLLALHHEDMRAAALLTALFLVFALGPLVAVFKFRCSRWWWWSAQHAGTQTWNIYIINIFTNVIYHFAIQSCAQQSLYFNFKQCCTFCWQINTFHIKYCGFLLWQFYFYFRKYFLNCFPPMQKYYRNFLRLGLFRLLFPDGLTERRRKRRREAQGISTLPRPYQANGLTLGSERLIKKPYSEETLE